jgi:hypothetical protein
MATCIPGSTGDYCCDTTAPTSCCSRMDHLDLRGVAEVRAVTTTSSEVKSSSSVKTTSSSDKASTTSSGKSSSPTQSSSQVSSIKSSTLLTTTTATSTTSTSTSSTSSTSTTSSITATPTTAPASSGMSTPVKVGVIAGGVVGLALVGFLFWMAAFLFRRRRQNKINAGRARELEMRALNNLRSPPGGPGNKGGFSNSVDEIETMSRPLRTQTPPQYGRDYGSGNNKTGRIFENPLAAAHQYGPVPPEEEYSEPQHEVGRRPSQQQYQSIPRRNPSQQQYVAFSPIEPPSQSPVATYPGQQQYIPARQPSQPSTARYEMGYSSSPTQFQPSPPPARPFAELASPTERQMTPAEELAAARARSNLSRAGELRDDTGGGLNHSLSILSAPGREGPGGGRAYHEL